MASETPASDHPAPPSQDEVVKELQSDVKGKIESEATCPPGPAPASSDPEIHGAKDEERPKAEAPATEVEAIPPTSDQVVKAALLSEDKPVVEELVNKDKPVGSPEDGEEKAEVEEATEEKPEDKQVDVHKDEVEQGIAVVPELLEAKVEECMEKKIEDTPVEVEKKAEDAMIVEKVTAPDESTGSEPAEVEKKIESDSSILGEKPRPEPDEKEVEVSKPEADAGKEMVEESKVEPVVEASPEKAGPEPAEKEVEELKVEPVGIELHEGSGTEKEKTEEIEVKLVDLVCQKSKELPTKVVEPIETAEDIAVSAAACKPEVAQIEQVGVPEAEDIKLLKEKETSATEDANNNNECYPTDKIVEKAAGEQGNLRSELAEKPVEVKQSSEDKVAEEKGVVGENLVPCKEKATEDVTNFTPEKTCEQGKESRELDAETIEVKGSSDNKADEPEVEPKAEEKSVVAEELVPCAEKPAEAVIDSATPSQPAEKSTETIVTPRDIELKEAPAALVETEKAVETSKGKDDKEGIKEKTEAEDKAEEPVQPIEAKIEEEKRVDEPAKRDIQQPECNKDSEETTTTQEAYKGDVNVKPQKQSIVKMVKQSLVKAKKAIIGKSHNSKTTASEPKDNANN